MDGQTSHQRWEDLVKLFEVLQSVEYQGFLCCLPCLTLIFTKLFTKKRQVARLKHDLEDNRTGRNLLELLGTPISSPDVGNVSNKQQHEYTVSKLKYLELQP